MTKLVSAEAAKSRHARDKDRGTWFYWQGVLAKAEALEEANHETG